MKGRIHVDKSRCLSHTAWDCNDHVISIPKGRRTTLVGQLRQHLGGVLHKLVAQKERQILEGHRMPDHVHMIISIPPKHRGNRCARWAQWERAEKSTSPVVDFLAH